jgi:hypothetical protein
MLGSRFSVELLLGTPHSEGDGSQITAEWFLVTDHGSATIYNHWAFGDEEYGIDAANDRVALLVVEYLRANRIEAYCLYGGMT